MKRVATRSRVRDPVKDSVPYMLQVAARLQTTKFMASMPVNDVHPAESYVLHELWKTAPLSQTELCERLDIGNATVGQTVRRLEHNGFVKRGRIDGDRRRVMVRLTDKGDAAREIFAAATASLIAEIDSVLGSREAQKLLVSLRKLTVHFRSVLTDTALGADKT
jgi:MarR family transcriptional regulator, organic hydroperoxide resistance regulator